MHTLFLFVFVNTLYLSLSYTVRHKYMLYPADFISSLINEDLPGQAAACFPISEHLFLYGTIKLRTSELPINYDETLNYYVRINKQKYVFKNDFLLSVLPPQKCRGLRLITQL